MKTNKKFLTILTLCIALVLTACGATDAAGTDKTKESLTETGTVSTDSSNTALDDLYQQENQIFADHEAVWNKVFGMMSKSDADPSGNYADYLADTIEANKDSFTEDEWKTLTDDMETIRKIEEQIAELEQGTTAADPTAPENNSEADSPFRNFSGQDFDGNSVDESLFSGNAVTVVNFWFTGCKPCVAELSMLNELNNTLKAMGGEVIGINSQIFSTSGGSMGLSFAIPINIATQVKDQILKNGKVTRGRIGVMIQSLTPELAKGFGLPEDTKGALVSRTDKDSPAAKAGLQSGDIIVGVDGTHVKNYSDIPRQISFAKPGSTVKLTVIRNKKEITVPVTVGVADGKTNTLKAGEESDTPKAEAKAGKLGVSVRPLTAKEAKKAGTSGLLVGNATGAAASAGIASGDVIVAVNGQPVKTVSDLSKAIEGKKQIAILVQRGGDQIYVPVNLDSSED